MSFSSSLHPPHPSSYTLVVSWLLIISTHKTAAFLLLSLPPISHCLLFCLSCCFSCPSIFSRQAPQVTSWGFLVAQSYLEGAVPGVRPASLWPYKVTVQCMAYHSINFIRESHRGKQRADSVLHWSTTLFHLFCPHFKDSPGQSATDTEMTSREVLISPVGKQPSCWWQLPAAPQLTGRRRLHEVCTSKQPSNYYVHNTSMF